MEPSQPKGGAAANYLQAHFIRLTNDLKALVGDSLNQGISSIEEQDFIRHFLPLFSGEIKDKNSIEVGLKAWYAIAGSAFQPVNIVSRGQIVAVVPEIMRNLLSGQPKVDSPITANEIIDRAIHVGELSPNRGLEFLNAGLNSRYLETPAEVTQMREQYLKNPSLFVDNQHAQAWQKLLARYGKSFPEKQASAQAKADNSGDDDMFDFD